MGDGSGGRGRWENKCRENRRRLHYFLLISRESWRLVAGRKQTWWRVWACECCVSMWMYVCEYMNVCVWVCVCELVQNYPRWCRRFRRPQDVVYGGGRCREGRKQNLPRELTPRSKTHACLLTQTYRHTHTHRYTHTHTSFCTYWHALTHSHTHTDSFSRKYHSYDIFIANKLSSSKAPMYICHISKRSTSHTLVSNHSSL